MKRLLLSRGGTARRRRIASASALGLVLWPVVLPASAQGPETASAFDEAAGYTLRLGADSARQGKAEADVRAARAAFLPKVTIGGEWVLAGSTVYHPDVTRLDPESYQTKDSSVIALEASLTVYDGSKRLNILRAADALSKAGREASLDTRQQLFLDAASAALAVMRDRTIVEKRRAAVERQRRTLQISREMLVEQSVTLTDIALASARVDEAQAALAGAMGDLKVTEIEFQRLIGRPPSRGLSLKIPGARLPRSASEAAARAEIGAPGPRAARRIAEAAAYRTDAARSDFYPTVELIGRASSKYDASPIIDQVDNYTALVRVKMPLFDPTLKPALDGAAAEASQRRYQAEAARLDAVTNARSAFSARQTAAAQAAQLSGQIANAVSAVKGMRIEQELGTRTINDVLDAQSSLAEAEIVAARIAYDRDRSAFALLAVMGELAESDVLSPAVVTASREAF